MALEGLILDPVEVAAPGRVELDLHDGAIVVGEAGPDWGSATIAAYMAEQERGETVVDYRVPNRVVRIPLTIGGSDPASFAASRAALQAKVALIQREGGWLKRTMKDSTYLFLDVVNAELKLGGSTSAAQYDIDSDAELVLECLPDFYGDPIVLADHTETTNPELVAVEAEVLGDYPGRVEITVDEDSGQDQLGIFGHFRCRNYSADSTAAPVFAAQSLSALDSASNATIDGRACVRHSSLATRWTPMLGLQLRAGTYLTHVGTYVLRAACYSTSAALPSVRAVWDVGDLIAPSVNSEVAIPAINGFYILNLGVLRLNRVPFGTHRWSGIIQGRGESGGENAAIYRVWMECVDEAHWLVSALSNNDTGNDTYVARDEFNQARGALAGLTAPVGGNWSGAGDSDDFTVTG